MDLDFSLTALFLRAPIVVKLVMVLLLAASVWAWAVIVAKLLAFTRTRRANARFDRAFWSGEPLEDVFDSIGERPSGAAERVFAAGMGEWRRSLRDDGGLIPGLVQRVDRAMNVAIAREEARLMRGLTLLGSIGAVAPFVGLFGTVWGIMRSFEDIALAQDTSLTVVAPGIAEALMATALGLLAAIPAVIFYNKLGADANKLLAGLEGFADEFATILSRQTDED